MGATQVGFILSDISEKEFERKLLFAYHKTSIEHSRLVCHHLSSRQQVVKLKKTRKRPKLINSALTLIKQLNQTNKTNQRSSDHSKKRKNFIYFLWVVPFPYDSLSLSLPPPPPSILEFAIDCYCLG